MLAESVPLVQGNAAWDAGFTGSGRVIAILDTGVDKAHTLLS
jgi:subtilisin family serine protease